MTIRSITENLLAQYEQKNLAYGNNAHKTYCKFGKAAYAMRLTDKMQRYETLLADSDIQTKDESIEDTLGDAITYLCMFAADIFAHTHEGEANPDSVFNIDRTKEYLVMLGCLDERELSSISNAFTNECKLNSNSLSDTVYALYKDENTTISTYIMFAGYMLNELYERMKNH